MGLGNDALTNHNPLGWHYSLGDGNRRLFTLDREPMTDQGMDVPKVQVGEPVNFIEILYRWVWVRVTYRHRNVSETAAPLKPTISWVLGMELTAQTADINRLENISASWPEPLPGSSVWSWFLLGLPAVPCFLWATGLRVAFRSLCCFSFLWVRVSFSILSWPRMFCRSDWLHTQFAYLRDQDHVLQCPSNPCPFVCFVFSVLRNGLAM